ncbi:MAG: L,D-transpeptidase family protein [Gammaproteobacteria bacterium]|nr:L,D-transpeptidase family protein [Gammaproteobacteria bacterium]
MALLLIVTISLPTFADNNHWLDQITPSSHLELNLPILKALYRDQHYLWLDKNQLSSHAHDALDFIAAATQHGLRRDDYHWTELQKLNPSTNTETAQLFDLVLSDGLLKLIDHLQNGTLHAKSADPSWFIEQPKFNNLEFLQQAILQPHLKSELNKVVPDSEQYRLLSQALTDYQRYVDRGGWSDIPDMPLLKPGDTHPNVALIQQRLAFEDEHLTLSQSLSTDVYAPLLQQAVKRFQKKYNLKVDGIIGSETRQQMNVSATDRLNQIKVALERHRWLPKNLGERYVLVNLANYSLTAVKQGQEKLEMPVIVGQTTRQTPSFSSDIDRLVFNPYWNVPTKLARLDLLPKQKKDLNYFYQHDIRMFSTENGQRIEHDPYAIDWQSLSSRHFPYTLRQDPGEHNALGRLKFMFPNKWDIYLHDTPHKELFSEVNRSFSSGCIRVQDPIALANFSLDNSDSDQTVLDTIASNQNRGQKLAQPLKIYVVYITASVIEGELSFSSDVYHRDKQIANML